MLIKLPARNTFDEVIRSIETITSDRNDVLFLVADEDDINQVLQNASGYEPEKAFINALTLESYRALAEKRHIIASRNIHVISSYSHNDYDGNDCSIRFFESNAIRPLLMHVFNECMTDIQPKLPASATVGQVGSAVIENFPCKLDLDIVISVPEASAYESVVSMLAAAGFTEPREGLRRKYRVFMYAEMLGVPVDIHVVHCAPQDCFLTKQHKRLCGDSELLQEYRRFKLTWENKSLKEYRRAKQLFNRQHLGAEE